MSAHHPVAPVFRHAVHHLADPDEFVLAISGGSLSADFLTPQQLPTHVELFQAPEWTLDFHEAHVKARVSGPLPAGWASLGLMRGPTSSVWHGFAGGPGLLVCTPPGEIIDGRISPGFASLAVNVPARVWEECRQLAGVERASFGSVVAFHLPPLLYAHLERRLRTLRRRLRIACRASHLATRAVNDAAEFATHLVTLAWELSVKAPPPRITWQNRIRLARRAEDWMRDHLGETVRVPDVCLALRVSRRELEYAFRVTFDQGPRDYLEALRLNAIRRALRQGDQHVSHVAVEHGITHFGRLAALYCGLFGELPGTTRSR